MADNDDYDPRWRDTMPPGELRLLSTGPPDNWKGAFPLWVPTEETVARRIAAAQAAARDRELQRIADVQGGAATELAMNGLHGLLDAFVPARQPCFDNLRIMSLNLEIPDDGCHGPMAVARAILVPPNLTRLRIGVQRARDSAYVALFNALMARSPTHLVHLEYHGPLLPSIRDWYWKGDDNVDAPTTEETAAAADLMDQDDRNETAATDPEVVASPGLSLDVLPGMGVPAVVALGRVHLRVADRAGFGDADVAVLTRVVGHHPDVVELRVAASHRGVAPVVASLYGLSDPAATPDEPGVRVHMDFTVETVARDMPRPLPVAALTAHYRHATFTITVLCADVREVIELGLPPPPGATMTLEDFAAAHPLVRRLDNRSVRVVGTARHARVIEINLPTIGGDASDDSRRALTTALIQSAPSVRMIRLIANDAESDVTPQTIAELLRDTVLPRLASRSQHFPLVYFATDNRDTAAECVPLLLRSLPRHCSSLIVGIKSGKVAVEGSARSSWLRALLEPRGVVPTRVELTLPLQHTPDNVQFENELSKLVRPRVLMRVQWRAV